MKATLPPVPRMLILIAVLTLWQCGQTSEQMSVPDGLTIVPIVTTSVDEQNRPANDVEYLPAFLKDFVIRTTFTGVVDGSHYYQATIVDQDGNEHCKAPAEIFASQGGTYVSLTEFSRGCLTEPGEYTVRIYLDRAWVAAKALRILSEEETTSGAFDAYWNKGSYMALFPSAPSKGSEWTVKQVTSLGGDVTNLFVTTHEGFNRIFYVQRDRASNEINLMEYREGWLADLVFHFPNGEGSDPRNIRFRDGGDKLYFYNKHVKGSFDLNTGEKSELDDLQFPVAEDNGFMSPSAEHWVTSKAMLDNKESLVSSGQYCNDPNVMWASWNNSKDLLYYWIECGQGSDSGFFVRDLVKGKTKKLLTGIEDFRYPCFFENNGTDFVAFIEQQEGGDATLKIATQANYPSDYGFGQNFTWGRELILPASMADGNGLYLKVDFYSSPQDYTSFEYPGAAMAGEIKKIGRISEGDWAARELYRVFDWITEEDMDDKVPAIYPTREYTYLVRNENELIEINGVSGERKDFRITDLDGKRGKSDLFKGATVAKVYSNLFIAGLHSPQLVDLPNSAVKLTRLGISEGVDKANLRKLFDHPTEGEMYITPSDDGAFYRINGDGTVTMYEYQYDFDGVSVDGTQLVMDEYASYTNRNCNGQALDMAAIVTFDDSRLVEIGTTSTNQSVYGFASAQDEALRKEYDGLKESFDRSQQTFKSFDEFIKSVPLFLWKDPFGRYVRWINIEYLTPANCEPILYLYPETTTEVMVELGEKINVINSNPLFQTNWHLTASTEGTLVDKATTKSYSHIFWEGNSGHLPPLEKGFVVDTADLRTFFNETLTCLGLNAKEAEDFQHAWLKEFKDARYYFIGFYDREAIDWYAPMKITPPPATVIRILMDYRPMADSIYVESPVFGPVPERRGFVAVEWAGIKRFPVSGSRPAPTKSVGSGFVR